MPGGKLKSRSLRRVFVRTPGSKVKLSYRKRKPARSICGSCGSVLSGVPREIPSRLGKLPKTARRPERAYGGVLCSKCSRDVLKFRARAE